MQIENKTFNGRQAAATVDGIRFERIPTSGMAKGAIMNMSGNVWKDTSDTWKAAINAVDIDWNNAVLPNASTTNGGTVEINTTGELLKLINDMQDEIYVLTAAVIALTQN